MATEFPLEERKIMLEKFRSVFTEKQAQVLYKVIMKTFFPLGDHSIPGEAFEELRQLEELRQMEATFEEIPPSQEE